MTGPAERKFDGWARPGDEVIFLGRHGYDWELEQAKGLFSVGERLTVRARRIGDWSSSYQFEGHGDRHFNTVMFEPATLLSPESPTLDEAQERDRG